MPEADTNGVTTLGVMGAVRRTDPSSAGELVHPQATFEAVTRWTIGNREKPLFLGGGLDSRCPTPYFMIGRKIMLPKVCMACGGSIKHRVAENPNVCEGCICEVVLDEPVKKEAVELATRMRVSDEPHPPRRRSPVIGDHSHERKTSPALPRRRHQK